MNNLLRILRKHTLSEVSKILGLSEDDVTLCHISTILLKRICDISDIKKIWIPGVTLGDGMAYDYAEAHNSFLRDMILRQISSAPPGRWRT